MRKVQNLPMFAVCLLFLSVFSSFGLPAFADLRSSLPGSVEPSVISNQLSSTPPQTRTYVKPDITHKEKPANNGLGPQAEKIKFKLTKVILEGNRTFSEKQLLPLYQDKLNKVISIAELQGVVQSITNMYRNNGYILSRAILPPQHVANGIVHIQIIEGYIDEAKIAGKPKGAKGILLQYGKKITQSKPLQIRVMEHDLRLANEVPGATVRAVLEPSKKSTGASEMILVADEKTFSGYVSYDNYGTRYIGPNQVTANMNANSIFRSGDSSHITVVRTSRPQELKYLDISHDTPLGDNGMRLAVGGNNALTQPGFVLAPTKLNGDATNLYSMITYPVLRARDQDLTLDAGVNYIDTGTNVFDSTLYNDHIRSAKVGATYNLADRFYGTNSLSAHLEHGFGGFLGASDDPTSPTVSRFGADGHYTKINVSAGRSQQLFWRLSAFLYATGQYSYDPLLASPQFSYGGSQLGRGYDPGELVGDRGAAGSIELRLSTAPGWFLLQTAQPYLFYDGGVIWNMKNVAGTKQKQSATSTGLGVRFVLTSHLSGNLMITQPLTKQVAAEEFIGQGRDPRGYFSLVASM